MTFDLRLFLILYQKLFCNSISIHFFILKKRIPKIIQNKSIITEGYFSAAGEFGKNNNNMKIQLKINENKLLILSITEKHKNLKLIKLIYTKDTIIPIEDISTTYSKYSLPKKGNIADTIAIKKQI